MGPLTEDAQARLVAELRAAGCVFAEDEAALLVEAADDDDHLLQLTASGRRANRS